MLPTVDANLWSRSGGWLTARRSGGRSIGQALKKGLEGLDNPKWIGTVLNEASEFDRMNYAEQYYTLATREKENRAIPVVLEECLDSLSECSFPEAHSHSSAFRKHAWWVCVPDRHDCAVGCERCQRPAQRSSKVC